jgi:hypothetical protein
MFFSFDEVLNELILSGLLTAIQVKFSYSALRNFAVLLNANVIYII